MLPEGVLLHDDTYTKIATASMNKGNAILIAQKFSFKSNMQ